MTHRVYKHLPAQFSPARLARAALLALVLALPAVAGNAFQQRLAAEVLLLGTAAMSLGLLVGFGGMVSLGHAAVFGASGYVAALLAPVWGAQLPLLLLAGVGTGAVVAGIMGVLAARVSGLFFLVLTLVCGQMVWELVFRWHDVTGGADGLRGFGTLRLGDMSIAGTLPLYALCAALALTALWVARSFIQAPPGRALTGSREQPLRMRALGYSLARIRLTTFVLSGALAGAAGALYPFVNQYIGPGSVHWSLSATFIIMLVLGGVRSLWGGFIGAAFYILMQTFVSSWTERWQLLVGLAFVATVILMPNGVAPALAQLAPWWRQRRAASTPATTASQPAQEPQP